MTKRPSRSMGVFAILFIIVHQPTSPELKLILQRWKTWVDGPYNMNIT